MVLQVTTKQLSTLTEEQLLHRLAAGERNAFWTLWQQHRDYLFACCLQWMNGNSTEAEDLLSQGMVKAWEKAPKYAEQIANFKSWLKTLIRNLWLDIKRRQGASQVEDIEVYAAQEDLGMVSGNQTPQSALEHDEKNMVIRAAIEELPAKMRETFMGHFYEELSYQEIGEQQDISYQNVCKRISMARAILVKQLRGYFIGEAGITTELAVTPATTMLAIEEISQVKGRVEANTGEEETQELGLCDSKSDLTAFTVTCDGTLEVMRHSYQCLEVVLCKSQLASILPRTKFEQQTIIWGSQCVSVLWRKKQHQVGKLGGDSVSLSRSPP